MGHLSLFEPADVNLSARAEGSSPGEKQELVSKLLLSTDMTLSRPSLPQAGLAPHP